ncbi:unnamed protein product [Sympodiomycopsis kandeliae]
MTSNTQSDKASAEGRAAKEAKEEEEARIAAEFTNTETRVSDYVLPEEKQRWENFFRGACGETYITFGLTTDKKKYLLEDRFASNDAVKWHEEFTLTPGMKREYIKQCNRYAKADGRPPLTEEEIIEKLGHPLDADPDQGSRNAM